MTTPSRKPALIRASGLTGYRELVTRLGGDAGSLLQQFHIAPAALDRGDELISFRAMIRLLEATARMLECPDFGMRLALEQDLKVVGPLAIIGMNSETVGSALKVMIEHMEFYSPILMLSMRGHSSGSDQVLLTWDVVLENEPHKRQVTELALALFHRDMQLLTKGHFVPAAVLFRHGTRISQAKYRPYFGGAPIRFNQPDRYSRAG